MISFIAEGSLFFEKMIRIGNFASGKDFLTTLYQQRDQDFVHALFKEVNNLYRFTFKNCLTLFCGECENS
jgi:hypothetical protein